MHQLKPSVYFIFPYRGVGGVPVLFVRMAEYLSHQGEIQAYLVDYPDGAMATLMKASDCNILVPYQDDKTVVIPSGSHAVFQSMTPWSIFPQLKIAPDVRLLFWNCHPFNLVPTLPGLRQYMQSHLYGSRQLLRTLLHGWRNTTRDFLVYLLNNHGIIFMDYANVVNTSRYLDIEIDSPKYLPIPIMMPLDLKSNNKKYTKKSQKHSTPLHITWIGRVVDFKFYILKLTLEKLNFFAPLLNRPLIVTIIGDGALCSDLKALVKNWSNIKVVFINHIDLEKLPDYLHTNTDLIIAMGTSILEGAKLGIPSILLDFSYTEVDTHYHYQWLYTRQGYTLGDVIESQHLTSTTTSLLERIQELLSNPREQGLRCQLYTQQYHSLYTVARQFMNALNQSTATWGDLQQRSILQKSITYSVFRWLRKLKSSAK